MYSYHSQPGGLFDMTATIGATLPSLHSEERAAVRENLPSIETTTHSIDEHYDKAINVKVGEGADAIEFGFHRGLLKFYSGYFRASIQHIEDGKFAESASGIIELPDEGVDTMKLFRRWLYCPHRKLTPTDCPDWQALTTFDLCKLWCFAERRIIPMLQNRAVDLIISRFSKGLWVNGESLRYAYEQSSEGSQLRGIMAYGTLRGQLVIDSNKLAMDEGEEEWYQEWRDDVGSDVREGKVQRSRRSDADWYRCRFHVHAEDVRCEDQGWKTY